MELITLKNKKQTIQDILMHPLKINKDESGILAETLRTDWKNIYSPERTFAMQYYSKTESGIARDEDVWHYHPRGQEDRLLVVKGAIVVAIADNRETSPTKGKLNLFYMECEQDPYILLVPKRTLHGFMVVSAESAILLNFPTRLYDPQEEGRVPYGEANIKNVNGALFNWSQVRRIFPHLSHP